MLCVLISYFSIKQTLQVFNHYEVLFILDINRNLV